MIKNGKKLCDLCEKESETLYQNPGLHYTKEAICMDCLLRITKIMTCPKCYSITDTVYKDSEGNAVCKNCLIKSLHKYNGENKDDPGDTESEYYDHLDHLQREQSLCDEAESKKKE